MTTIKRGLRSLAPRLTLAIVLVVVAALGAPIAAAAAPRPEIVVTEVMQNPQATFDSRGEWFELHNPGISELDLAEWTVRDRRGDTHTIRTSLVIPGGGYVVLARNGDPSRNGGVAADYVYGDSVFLFNGRVFVPSWFPVEPLPFTPDKLQISRDVANCALAFAQQHAADHGGDPTRLVADGFSAGILPALLVTLEPAAEPIPGCGTDAVPTPVRGVVLGDGDSFLYTRNFDDAFDADPTTMQRQLSAWLDASEWPPDLDAEFFVWTAGDGTNPRRIGDPADETGWLAERDPDGSIRADLERLGQLEDGIVSYVDAGQLLELRLSEGGLTVTLDEYPGGHTTRDKVQEIVGYFLAATTQ
jgi:predicted esterase